jgi:hypothetical protein
MIFIIKDNRKFLGIKLKDFEDHIKYWLGDRNANQNYLMLEISANKNDIFLVVDKHTIDLGEYTEKRGLIRFMDFYKVLFNKNVFWLYIFNHKDYIEIL